MNILITGGGGFLGAKLARDLISRGQLAGKDITRITLADQYAPSADLTSNSAVTAWTGKLLDQMDQIKAQSFDAVFHLASAVSGECEADFDLGLRSNLDSTRALLDALRANHHQTGKVAKLVFSSSCAVFGSDPARAMPRVLNDDTYPMPQSSYGTHKFMLEQLVADYSRKGYIEGRSVRLVTVSVRPGKPNGAASGFFSGIVREPVAGLEAVCPVKPETRVALASPNTTVGGILRVAEVDQETFGGRIALNMPALCISVQDMLDSLGRVCGKEVRSRVRFESDPATEKLVYGWPGDFENPRARAMGLPFDHNFDDIIKQHLAFVGK